MTPPRTSNLKIYLAFGLATLFVLIAITEMGQQDFVGIISNVTLAFAMSFYGYGEWTRQRGGEISKSQQIVFALIGFILVAVSVGALIFSYLPS